VLHNRCYTKGHWLMPQPYLTRRGATYYFRARLPSDLASRLAVTELCRSLGTMEFRVARIRCVAATLWFHELTNRLRTMTSLNRTDLERAANTYFRELLNQQSGAYRPEGIVYDEDDQHQHNLEETKVRIAQLDRTIQLKEYAPYDDAARSLIQQLGVDFDKVDAHLQLIARQLVVRAQRQQMRYFLHTLETPLSTFTSDDPVFAENKEEASHQPTAALAPAAIIRRPELTLERTASMYEEYLAQAGVGTSMLDETARVLRWLQEEIDPIAPVSTISRDQVRDFRDCLSRLRNGVQGRKLPFRQRLTEDKTERLKFVTMERYWRSVQAFLKWLQSEYDIENVATGIAFKGGKNDEVLG
jgi:hypothetical protein